jgi:predicted HicB family RNase H-like nuclease
VFYFLGEFAIIIILRKEAITMSVDNKKFIITPKDEKSVTMTIRISSEINTKLERLSMQSNRSRNELINKALEFAFNNLEFVDDN